jgi:hypothetical protein
MINKQIHALFIDISIVCIYLFNLIEFIYIEQTMILMFHLINIFKHHHVKGSCSTVCIVIIRRHTRASLDMLI